MYLGMQKCCEGSSGSSGSSGGGSGFVGGGSYTAPDCADCQDDMPFYWDVTVPQVRTDQPDPWPYNIYDWCTNRTHALKYWYKGIGGCWFRYYQTGYLRDLFLNTYGPTSLDGDAENEYAGLWVRTCSPPVIGVGGNGRTNDPNGRDQFNIDFPQTNGHAHPTYRGNGWHNEAPAIRMSVGFIDSQRVWRIWISYWFGTSAGTIGIRPPAGGKTLGFFELLEPRSYPCNEPKTLPLMFGQDCPLGNLTMMFHPSATLTITPRDSKF